MNLKKCVKCKSYTLQSEHCSVKTKEAGYKFIRILKNSEVSE